MPLSSPQSPWVVFMGDDPFEVVIREGDRGKMGMSNLSFRDVHHFLWSCSGIPLPAELVSPPPTNPPAIVVTVPRISSCVSSPPSRSRGRDTCPQPRP
ncbi:hypothetical protein SESBI_02104 [Sesbania bispinosa]|nr:hypothetical protein SESBI_02104 [Sesbania bispinosa]